MPDLRTSPGDTSWFTHDRFGLFIHWGLYALPARHEWVKSREQIGDDAYDAKYFRHFEPDLYDPAAWADAAAGAGMKYFVVTTKHHEGFCLWDSDLTDYKAPNTPAGRDLLRPMVEAFRERGIRTGFYHSIIDWHHPEYVIDDRNHSRRGELPTRGEVDDMIRQAGGGAENAQSKATGGDPNAGRDQGKYADYLHGQVRELLTRYGDVDVLWFDFSFPTPQGVDRTDFSRGKGREAWRSPELLKMIRELQPDIVLNDRLDYGEGWDIKTPEQAQPRKWVEIDGTPVVWEACQTLSGSWGYHREESSFRSTRQLITTLIDCVSKGGNLLLNVGPTGRGEFDHRALDRLAGIGRWMHYHSRSIYGCTQAPEEFAPPQDCRLTYHPEKKRLYVHLLSWPYKYLHLDGKAFVERVEYAQLLNDASELVPGMNQWHARNVGAGQETLSIAIPQREPEGVEVPVVELLLK